MVMAIISSVNAGILLIMSAIFLHSIYKLPPVSYLLLVAMIATMLIIGIASASLTCYPLCCSSTKQGAVHYSPNQVPASVHCLRHCHIVTLLNCRIAISTIVQSQPGSHQRRSQRQPDGSTQPTNRSRPASTPFHFGAGEQVIKAF